jgi:diguanylate cyclase (GGDEF)-like protein
MITLDVPTLFLVTIYVEVILGLLLLFAWIQNTATRAVAWWGFAHLLRAGSVTLFGLYDRLPDLLSIDLANAILLTSFAVTWTGARVFDGRKPEPLMMIAGAVLWLVLCRIPAIDHWTSMRALISAFIIAGYTWATAAELWRGRAEALVSRLPATFLLFAHGALFLLRTPLSALLPWSPANQVFGSIWLTVLSSEALLFTISIAFIQLAMAKERIEQLHKTASMIDQLTGIANRRGFLFETERLWERYVENPKLSAVLLIDLDNFKSVNDRFGHAVGDKVLQTFAHTLSGVVRASDVVGRLGGEEFAVVLYHLSRERAHLIAERIRSSFAETAAVIDGRPVASTVSIGMVMSDDPSLGINELLRRADEALYRAKEHGRNRVETVGSEQRLLERAAVRRQPATPATVNAA